LEKSIGTQAHLPIFGFEPAAGVSYNTVYSDYASVTSIIHCIPWYNFLISCCYQQTPVQLCRLLGYWACGWCGHCCVTHNRLCL